MAVAVTTTATVRIQTDRRKPRNPARRTPEGTHPSRAVISEAEARRTRESGAAAEVLTRPGQ